VVCVAWLAAACGAGPVARIPRGGGIISSLSLLDSTALQQGRYPVAPSSVVVCEPLSAENRVHDFVMAAVEAGFEAVDAVLRNPGSYVCIVQRRNGKPLALADRVELSVLAKRARVDILPTTDLPIHYGPDGHTPLVMKNVLKYDPAQFNTPVEVEVTLAFPTTEGAKEAARYVDRASYSLNTHTVPGGSELHASCTEANGAATDEYDAFGPLARKFHGKVESVSSSG